MCKINIFFELLENPAIASVIFSVLMSILYSLMKLYIKRMPDKIDKVKTILEFPINLCCIFSTSLVAVEISKGVNLTTAILQFLIALIVSFFCCIFRNNANAVLLKENFPILTLLGWGFLDWFFTICFGSVIFIIYYL